MARCNHQGTLRAESEVEEQYTCAGCAQFGYGPCCRCNMCGSRLHVDCAFHKDTITHPFFPGSVLRFCPSGDSRRYCDACGRDINGYVYHSADGYDLHPTCASLRETIHVPDTEIITLSLRKKMSSACGKCGKKKLDIGCRPVHCWGYETRHKEYCLHVFCANEILMELQIGSRRGQEPGDERAPSLLLQDSISHPFFPGSVFRFQPSAAGSGRYCSACGMDVLGPCYHCSDTEYDLHPACASLERNIRDPGMEVPLVLRRRMSSSCAWCGTENPGSRPNCWGYEWGREEYHVYCAQEMLKAAGKEEEEGLTRRGREVRLDLSYAAPARDQLVVRRRPGGKVGKFAKFMNMVKIAVTALISALVGDPTTLIVTFIATMLTN